MADDWYYAQSNERKGPVPFAKLKAMAKGGWLAPDDLVWQSGMRDWAPAREVEGLCRSALAARLRKTIDGLSSPAKLAEREDLERTTPPGIPERLPEQLPAPKKRRPQHPEIDWGELAPRHFVAAAGGFLAALGIAFTAIAQSRLALAFTLSGLFIAAVGLYVEIGGLLSQAITNIGTASKEAAERRLRAKELAIEKQRLDLKAAKLAQEKAARDGQPVPPSCPPSLSPAYPPEQPGQIVVINQPPVRRWSPGLAAVLSFFLPGLGQLYKGQIINGIVWFVFVGMGYVALVLPGLILHFFCVLGALSGNPWTEGKTTVVRQ
jgi:hypothetical protein